MFISFPGAAGTATNTTTSAGKFNLNLPVLGNGSVSAPVTTQNSPDPNQKMSLASNTFLGIQNTIGKITGMLNYIFLHDSSCR